MGAGRKHLGVIMAAIVQKVGNRPPDPGRIDTVDHVAGHLARLKQASLFQRGKMERQARGRKAKRLRNLTGGHTSRSHRHHQADQIKTRFMRQRREG